MIRQPQVKLYHLKPQTLKHVEIEEVSKKLQMIHHWKGLELEITDFEYRHDRTLLAETKPSKT